MLPLGLLQGLPRQGSRPEVPGVPGAHRQRARDLRRLNLLELLLTAASLSKLDAF